MNFKANLSLHGLLTTFQGANLTLWSSRMQVIVGVAIAIMQTAIAAKAHWSNPDGSPAQLPYVKDDKF